MANPHPFYRFSKAWNAGFYPDNQIMSDLLNEIRNDLVTYVATNPWSGKTINQWYNLVKQFINTYTQSPYFGEFDFTIQKISDIPNWEYNINIFNPDLTATTAGQVITINGFFNNTTQQVVNANVNAFTPGLFFPIGVDFTLVEQEVKAREALKIVDLNGSAFFPPVYSLNQTTNVATSALARARDLQLVNGVVSRFPADNLPYQNQRIFELPQLDGDDNYIISIMERIIQASIADTDYTTSVLATYNSFTMPDGWVKSVNYPSFTTYERVQFNFVNAFRRKFILVGRLDGNWLWQRFVSDEFANPVYNFLSAYTETNGLPYYPLQAGRWLYNDDTFDFEFVEFTSGCYVSEEFYAMPAKPGDQFQFNVWDANMLGVDSALVGLFEQDGTFIQQIGTAIRPTSITCESACQYAFSYVLTAENVEAYLDAINNAIPSSLFDPPVNFKWTIESDEPGIIGVGSFLLIFGLPELTMSSITAIASAFGIVITEEDGNYTFTYTASNLPCGFDYTFNNELSGGVNDELFTTEPYTCVCSTIDAEQLQASVTIPSKQGCYRMGLYNEPTITPPSGTCELTFNYFLSGLMELNTMNEDYPGEFLTFALFDGTNYSQVYQCPTPFPIAPIDLITTVVDFGNSIPGMTVDYSEPLNDFIFTWVVTVDCGEEYRMQSGVTDAEDNWNYLWFATEYQPCECPPETETCFELYSLSNIINIDASDCFSTMIEFWQDSDSIAQGFEYFNGWKQRVRIGLNGGGEKPIIEESLYRQSNGVTRRPQNKQDLSVDLHTDFFDLDTQLAMTDATRYPYFIWEGKSIFVRGDVEVATTQDFTNQSSFETLSQMKFQALIQGFQPRNSSCLTC